jgi:hypothetical protein
MLVAVNVALPALSGMLLGWCVALSITEGASRLAVNVGLAGLLFAAIWWVAL